MRLSGLCIITVYCAIRSIVALLTSMCDRIIEEAETEKPTHFDYVKKLTNGTKNGKIDTCLPLGRSRFAVRGICFPNRFLMFSYVPTIFILCS